MKSLFISILACLPLCGFSQIKNDTLPFYEIQEYPDSYTAGTVAARMIDGLGFRFYWATEGLSESEMTFSPGENTRSIEATVDHIYAMVVLIANTVLKKDEQYDSQLTFVEKREKTLYKLHAVRAVLLESDDKDMAEMQIKFSEHVTYPFWNLINGQIADAIWHCGQIASFRRSAGNPFNSNVSLFNGKVKDN